MITNDKILNELKKDCNHWDKIFYVVLGIVIGILGTALFLHSIL
jgi:hypothetical protein